MKVITLSQNLNLFYGSITHEQILLPFENPLKMQKCRFE